MAKKRLTIRNLVPGEKYAVQVRAVGPDGASAWSQKFNFTAADDTLGGTRTPKPPILNSFGADASGQYVGEWTGVAQNTDDTLTVIARFEIELDYNGSKRVISAAVKDGTAQRRSFSFAELASLFGGVIPPTLTMKVRTVNSAGTLSPWSNAITATLPVPDPPRNVAAVGVTDGINVTWEPPLNMNHVVGYRVYLGTSAGFTPSPTNKVYEGPSLSFAYTTMSYDVTHYFKVVTYSPAGIQSTAVEVSGKPKSPFGSDLTAPLVPTLNNPTIDRTVLTAPKAGVSWTINETHADNADLAGFVVRWRKVGESGWRNSYFDKAARSGVIDLPEAFSNYEFQISAYDNVANYSAYSASKTLTGAVAAPAQTTGVDSVARFDGLKITWTESTSDSVKLGGRYEVQIKATNSFPDNTPDYTTGNTFLDVAGLPAGSTRYVRVRAVDSSGQTGAWSTVHTKTLPGFPAPPASDGAVPTAAPTNVVARGGLSYINVAWSPVSNNDAVTYEVFMSTAPGFTAATANRVGTSTGTSFVASANASGAALLKNTIYYVKVRATDLDGAGPVSSEASTTLTKVLFEDLGIDIPGENLYLNSSFEEESLTTIGLATHWVVYNSPPVAGVTMTPSRVVGRTGGYAQRIAWNGAHSGNKGIASDHRASVTKANTEYVVSFYARASAGATGFTAAWNQAPVAGTQVWLNNPTPSATEWKRYAFRFTTTATPDVANIFLAVSGLNTGAGWVEFDDMQIEAGSVPSAYKTGTVSISKLTSGRISVAELIIAEAGIIKSDNWNATSKTGYSLSSAGLFLYSGAVRANVLEADSSFVNNLNIASTLTVATNGVIKSSNYNATTGTGYQISTTGIDIRQGTVAASVLSAGVITSPDIKIGAGGRLTIDSTGTIQSNNYSATTGWRISSTGIEMNDANSTISASALKTGTVAATTITIGSGGNLRSSTWAAGTGARWQLSETGLTMYNGVITGSAVVTDQLTSQSTDAVTGRYLFTINNGGYAEFSGARIYGNTSVGTGTSNVIQSGNYIPNTTGWRIDGSGMAEFSNITSRYTRPAAGGQPEQTMSTRIYTGPNPYEAGSSWNVIEMQAGNAAWSPALIWTKYTSGSDPMGAIDITSPRLGTRNPARITLISTETTNKTQMQLNAQEINLMADRFMFGRDGANDVRFQLQYGGSGTAQRFSFMGAAGPGAAGKRINFSLGEFGLNRMSSLDENGSNQRLDITAHAVFFETSGANGNLGIMGGGAANRVMLANYSGGNSIVFQGDANSSRIRMAGMLGNGLVGVDAAEFTVGSDMAQKRNIKEVKSPVSRKMKSLKGYDYNRVVETEEGKRNKVSKDKYRGLMANEVQEIMPEVVVDSGEEGGLGINMYALLTNAVLAIGEYRDEIDELKAEIETLKGNKK